jgi:hypothetical protein
LEKHDQIIAFERIFKKNPLSSVLSFYAGLTQFVNASKETCDLLLRVMENPIRINTVVEKLQSADVYEPANDIRRLILALMNCVYESKRVDLMNLISFSPQMVEDNEVIIERISRPHIELNLSLMILKIYPTDCLSIGYFARLACEKCTYCVLKLCCCMLKEKEIKALSHELCKPTQNQNLTLNLTSNFLTKQALQYIRAVFTPGSGSGVSGLSVSGFLLEDIQLALKYIIEGLNSKPLLYLTITDISFPDNVPIAHHLVLLLLSGQHLNTLNLTGCLKIFTDPRVWLLFYEALKYNTSLMWLVLDGCGIKNRQLQLLAAAVTGGSRLRSLDISSNRYTAVGLTRFLQTLVNRVYYTHLAVIFTDEALDEHHSLVEEFNLKRNFLTQEKLSIGGKIGRWENDVKSVFYLLSDPKYYTRD